MLGTTLNDHSNGFFSTGKKYLSNNVDLAILTSSDKMEL